MFGRLTKLPHAVGRGSIFGIAAERIGSEWSVIGASLVEKSSKSWPSTMRLSTVIVSSALAISSIARAESVNRGTDEERAACTSDVFPTLQQRDTGR